jgi:hypothetical protein
MRQGNNSPKSGTMAPTTTADSNRHRASRREKGSTTAAWEMVNGIYKPSLSRHGHITDLYIHSMSNLDAINQAPGGIYWLLCNFL